MFSADYLVIGRRSGFISGFFRPITARFADRLELMQPGCIFSFNGMEAQCPLP